MNEELSDAIVESVHDIFHGFLALEVFPGVQIAEACQEDTQKTATVVSFNGVLRGSVILHASVSTAVLLAEALAGTQFHSLSENAREMLGELTDLIAGGMRTRLSAHGEIRLTPPIVVIGTQYHLNNASIFSQERQFFQVNGGTFCVECFYIKDSS
ncbi:MAG: chemotaxis protein CheX [Magnetococcales bacterium]|nr:chemotaxis protein CheX [Magnetococcales bacterium]